MSTASLLLTVGTTWGPVSDKCEKEKEKLHGIGRAELVTMVAAQELRETPAAREQALRLMRDWISQNPDIKNVRQGTRNSTYKLAN